MFHGSVKLPDSITIVILLLVTGECRQLNELELRWVAPSMGCNMGFNCLVKLGVSGAIEQTLWWLLEWNIIPGKLYRKGRSQSPRFSVPTLLGKMLRLRNSCLWICSVTNKQTWGTPDSDYISNSQERKSHTENKRKIYIYIFWADPPLP